MPTQVEIPYYKVKDIFDVYDCPSSLVTRYFSDQYQKYTFQDDNEVVDVTKSDFNTDSDLLNNKPNKQVFELCLMKTLQIWILFQSQNLQKRNCNPRTTVETPMATTERFTKIPKTYNEQKQLEKQVLGFFFSIALAFLLSGRIISV